MSRSIYTLGVPYAAIGKMSQGELRHLVESRGIRVVEVTPAAGDGAPEETKGSTDTAVGKPPVPQQSVQHIEDERECLEREGFVSRFGDQPRSDGRDLVDMAEAVEGGPGHCFTCDTPLTDTDDSGGWFCSDACRRFATED